MSKQQEHLSLGLNPNDDRGETLRSSMLKIESNTSVLFDYLRQAGIIGGGYTGSDALVFASDARLSDARKSVFPSGNHPDDYYALLNGNFDQPFHASNTVVSGIDLKETAYDLPPVKIYPSILDDFGEQFNNSKSLRIINENLVGDKQALIFANSLDSVLDDTLLGIKSFSATTNKWSYPFKLTNSGELFLNDKMIITSNGNITVDALSLVIDGAPLSLNTLKELANAIANNVAHTYTFSTALTWLVTHNGNSNDFLYEVFDSTNNIVHTTITIHDSNSFSVNFTEPTDGKVVIKF